ncbi:hypothetical protein HK105_202283 [Polyrhizophydium stewartii]|uniref:Uncharacterized protein n=1 Tax=Polyrhizophydium stewartii TaxID=2732419 RepID=A0ABR4NFS7_9FUNG
MAGSSTSTSTPLSGSTGAASTSASAPPSYRSVPPSRPASPLASANQIRALSAQSGIKAGRASPTVPRAASALPPRTTSPFYMTQGPGSGSVSMPVLSSAAATTATAVAAASATASAMAQTTAISALSEAAMSEHPFPSFSVRPLDPSVLVDSGALRPALEQRIRETMRLLESFDKVFALLAE